MVNSKTDWPWLWMLVAIFAIIAMGTFFVVASMIELPSAMNMASEETYDAIVGSGAFDSMSSKERQHHDWIIGVLGSAMIGWGIAGAFLVWFGLRPWIREGYPGNLQWTWQALLVGFSVWFVVDTGISAWNEVWFNVIFNTVLFFLLVIPLVYLIPQYLQNRQ
ncbi:MAG: hypothetical protein ACFFB3_22350 [Candidatus Hodarchaeota archaeon]